MSKYKITCTRCRESDIILIENGIVVWGDNKHIISGRKRLDGQWGFQCMCGNNDIMTRQEIRQIKNKQNPDPIQIDEILRNLIPDPMQFEMQPVT